MYLCMYVRGGPKCFRNLNMLSELVAIQGTATRYRGPRYSEVVFQVSLCCPIRINFSGVLSKCLQVGLAIFFKLNWQILKNNECT
jgi:hypothetical protein